MHKIINKTIAYGLGMLAILAFGVTIMPTKTNAQYPNTPYSSYGSAYVSSPVPAPAPTPTVYSSSTGTQNTAQEESKPAESNLAANAISASDGFSFGGIMQWVLLGILILIIVILVRKIFSADKKYHSTPLKHA